MGTLVVREFIIYGVIGCVSTLIDISIYGYLTSCVGVHYQLANIISVALSLLNGFLWNFYCNFSGRRFFIARMIGFYAVGMTGWLIGAVQLWFFIEVLEWNSLVSKIVAIIMCTVVQFILNKYLTFRDVPSEKIELLEWDSKFFGFQVGKLEVGSNCNIRSLKKVLGTNDKTLVYVFVDPEVSLDVRRMLLECGAVQVDNRVVYRKKIIENHAKLLPHADNVTGQIEALVYCSGWLSRFNRDERLRPMFKRLYLEWLKKELKHGKVIVYPDAIRPQGLITVTHANGEGHIGLFAVETSARRKGIGRKLLSSVDAYLWDCGVTSCEVVTQGDNVQAQGLYEKCGFKVNSTMGIWHLWR